MNRFIVLGFPKRKFDQFGRRNKATRRSFENNEVGANAYARLMHEQNRGQHFHVVDQHLRATTYRI